MPRHTRIWRYYWLVISKIKEKGVSVVPGYITVLILNKYWLDSQLVEMDAILLLPMEPCWLVPKAVLSFISSSTNPKAIFRVTANQCE